MRQFGRDTQLNGEDVEGRIGENNDRKEQRWVRVMGEGRRDTDRERSLRDGKWTMENVANRRIGYSVMDMAPKNFKSPLKILFRYRKGVRYPRLRITRRESWSLIFSGSQGRLCDHAKSDDHFTRRNARNMQVIYGFIYTHFA